MTVAEQSIRELLQAEGETSLERAERFIAEQGNNLTLEQVTGQRDLWIISACEWHDRMVAAEAASLDAVAVMDAMAEAADNLMTALAAANQIRRGDFYHERKELRSAVAQYRGERG